MKSIEEAFADLYNEKINNAELFDSDDIIGISHYSFKAGVEFAQQWISIEDELPISGTQFLLKDENGNIYIGCYIEEIRAFRPYGAKGKAGGITHWRLININ